MEQIDFNNQIDQAFLMETTLIYFFLRIHVQEMIDQLIFGLKHQMLVIDPLCLVMEAMDNVGLAIFKLLIIKLYLKLIKRNLIVLRTI